MKKLESPSAERNKGPIWELVFQEYLLKKPLSKTVHVLEVAAGTGVHTQFFGKQLADRQVPVVWQSSDPDASSVESQAAYIQEISDPSMDDSSWRTCGTAQYAKPVSLTLDENGIREPATESALAPASIDWMLNINMIHISHWSATQGLMKVAGELLKPGVGYLMLYGPYRVNGSMVESNMKFEQWLQAKDPAYGVRNLEDVVAEAGKHGLELETLMDMPANNKSVILRRTK